MSPAILYYMSLLISLSIAIGPTGNLICNDEAWTVVAAEWTFPAKCVYANTNLQNGAMSWIGEGMPESTEWSDYTVEMKMTPTNTEVGGANGGLAFNIQSVGPGGNNGQYYALSLFPVFSKEQVEIHMGKWNNNYQTVGSWYLDDVYTEGQAFYIKLEISTKVNVSVNVIVDNVLLGTWMEDKQPMWTYGSVGTRNYNLPATFTDFCVNGCVIEGADSGGGGGWIFVGLVLGGFFLYCVIGYSLNGYKTKKYGNVKENIPHIIFWQSLPRLVKVGCQVSVEFVKGTLCKKVGGSQGLMDTADDEQQYHAEDQEL